MEDGNPPPETNVIEGQPEVLYVQGVGNQGMVGQYPHIISPTTLKTRATTA